MASTEAPGIVRSAAPKLAGGLMLLAALLLPPASRAAQVAINLSTNYYFVTGTNRAAIRAAMTQLRPWKQTSMYDAHTEWDMRSSLTWRRADDQYFVASFQVKTKVVVTLPCWIPAPPVDPELAGLWREYFKGLSRHEQGHVQLAREATAELERRLSGMAGYNSAHELTTAANRVGSEVVAEFRKKEVTYDEETGHGLAQGAIFRQRRLAAD